MFAVLLILSTPCITYQMISGHKIVRKVVKDSHNMISVSAPVCLGSMHQFQFSACTACATCRPTDEVRA